MSEEERKEQDSNKGDRQPDEVNSEELVKVQNDGEGATDKGTDVAQNGPEQNLEHSSSSEGETSSKPVLSPLIVPSPTILSNHPADDIHAPDSPTTSLISALRLSLQQLTEQSHQLNTKLVTSFSRVADLEGTIDELREDNDQRSKTLQELEREKAQWEESMKTGLLVERDQIRDEMQRLAAGLVEEERRRGSAELGREKLEGEVDVLTATLFDQANTMVATERHGRVQAETRLKLAEDNLSVAEAAVRDMQVHLQSLSSAPQEAGQPQQPLTRHHRLITSHVPYNEFIAFINHIRMLRPQKQSSMSYYPPTPVSALLSQPFLARAVTEDHEPCLRLDVAPDLSWLSRRSVAAAIIAGELMIEPVSANTVLGATSTPAHELTCSLCSKFVFPNATAPAASPMLGTAPPAHPLSKTGSSTSRFSLKLFSNTSAPTSPSPAPPSPNLSQSLGSVYVFRVAPAATSTQAAADSKSYPLCRSGWCLERLRATCAFWHFVRSGLLQVVWKAEDVVVPQSHSVVAQSDEPASVQPPSLPPRKKSWGLGFKTSPTSTPASGSSWGLGFKGAGMSPPISPRIQEDSSHDAYIDKNDVQDAEREAKDNEAGTTEPAASDAVAESGDVVDLTEDIVDESTAEGLDQDVAVPVIVAEAVESSEVVEPVDPAVLSEEHLDPNTPKSSASSAHGSDGDEASFSTPKGTNAELSPAPSTKELDDPNGDASSEATAEVKHDVEEGVPEEVQGGNEQLKTDGDATTPAVVDTSPKVQSTDKLDTPAESQETSEAVTTAPTLPGETGAPPPVPRRAAARPRPASRVIDGETASGAVTPSNDGTRTPVVPEDAEPSSASETPVEGQVALEQSVDAPAEPAPPLPARGGVPPALPPRTPLPPALPAREPASSTLSASAPPLPPREKQRPTSLASTTGKTYAEGEEWEIKTWREIVKLKEAMWKARVGVEDVEV